MNEPENVEEDSVGDIGPIEKQTQTSRENE